MFLIIKSINSLQKRLVKPKEETPAPVTPEDILLLREIRDLVEATLIRAVNLICNISGDL